MQVGGISLSVVDGPLAVWTYPPGNSPPGSVRAPGPLLATITTPDGVTVVGPEELAPGDGDVQVGWRALKVAGPLDFELTGIVAGLTAPLAEARIPVFVISSYDTDYVLVRERDLVRAIAALEDGGHTVST